MEFTNSSLWLYLPTTSSQDINNVFYWENAIALHAMQGNRASSRGEGEVHGFCRVAAGTWGTFSSYDGDAHSKREFV